MNTRLTKFRAIARLPLTAGAGALFLSCAALAQQSWSQLGGGPAHGSRALQSPASLASPAWTRALDSQSRTIAWVGQSGPVVSDDRVLAIGSVTVASVTTFSLYAMDRATGAIAWAQPIPAVVAGSWSSPAIDRRNAAAVVASGTQVRAFDLSTGAPRWQTTLTRSIVNASPAITDGLRGGNRIFITDYDGVGTAGKLYCINADAHTIANPYDPGQIVWSTAIGATSGNTPACLGDRVYVATVGDWGFAPGQIMCFDARARVAPAAAWITDNPTGEGFFGGLAIAPDHRGALSVYAASYAFFGTTTSANLVKLDAASGELRWSADANRTSTIPIVLSDGRIILSTGVNGFGSLPAIQVFRDDDTSAPLIWDSSLATWTDANLNGVRDAGEFTSVGGWTNQPVVGVLDGLHVLYAGVMPTGASSTASCTQLRTILIDSPAAAPSILASSSLAAGSTPAIVDENLYSIGPAGLAAFGPTPPRYDVDGDGRLTVDDLHAWNQSAGERDINRDGATNTTDLRMLEAELQRWQRN